jgi:hypothetical protein
MRETDGGSSRKNTGANPKAVTITRQKTAEQQTSKGKTRGEKTPKGQTNARKRQATETPRKSRQANQKTDDKNKDTNQINKSLTTKTFKSLESRKNPLQNPKKRGKQK